MQNKTKKQPLHLLSSPPFLKPWHWGSRGPRHCCCPGSRCEVGTRPSGRASPSTEHQAGLGDHVGSRRVWAGPGDFCRPFSCPEDPYFCVWCGVSVYPAGLVGRLLVFSLQHCPFHLVSGLSAPADGLLRAEAMSSASGARNLAGAPEVPRKQPCSL